MVRVNELIAEAGRRREGGEIFFSAGEGMQRWGKKKKHVDRNLSPFPAEGWEGGVARPRRKCVRVRKKKKRKGGGGGGERVPVT